MLRSMLAMALVVLGISPAASQAGDLHLAATTGAPSAPTAAAIPPDLQALEEKMLALQLTSERVSESVSIEGPTSGPSGPLGGFSKSAVARAAAAAALISVSGEVAFAPPAANLRISVFGLTLHARLIGTTLYVEEPFLAHMDGGRPWVEEPNQHLEQATGGERAALGGDPSGGSTQAFGQLIEELNKARSITEVGPRTVDGQPVTAFTASIAVNDVGRRSAKQRHAFAKLARPLGRLEVFIAEDGLPVRAVFSIRLRGHQKVGLITQSDILAINIPVVVEPPPAAKTITQAQYRRLLKRESRRVVKRRRR